ncbi:MAG: UDP-N-acetylmuramate dehydrogenase [Bacteroidales bacterium]
MPELHHHFSLKNQNTFGIEIHAALFSRPHSLEELVSVLEKYGQDQLPLLVMGEGSNILFLEDYEGLIIRPGFGRIELLEKQNRHVLVNVGAGVNWDSWVAHTNGHGWYGLENLSLIPGSVGSAPIQNIGAYGVELQDHFAWLNAYDLVNKEVVRMKKEECEFGYRNSIFKTSARSRYLIMDVTFRLSLQPALNLGYDRVKDEFKRRNGKTPDDLRNTIISIRNSKLPDPARYGNAGSFFKNPLVDMTILKCIRAEHPDIRYQPAGNNLVKVPAAWLIEKAGWKGKRIGRVGTWPRQPLVVVNYGGANGREILDFTEQIREDVDRKFGVELEREVEII